MPNFTLDTRACILKLYATCQSPKTRRLITTLTYGHNNDTLQRYASGELWVIIMVSYAIWMECEKNGINLKIIIIISIIIRYEYTSTYR